MGNARARVVESLDESQVLADEMNDWYAQWEDIDAAGRHWTQLEFLATLTRKLLVKVTAETRKIDTASDIASVYDECRQADERTLYVRRLWRWYAEKFDQRRGAEDTPAEDTSVARTLHAADEVIWSCWKAGLKSLDAPPEFNVPVPLTWLSPQFAASTTFRTYVIGGSSQIDKIFYQHLGQIPIPVIDLPLMCQRRPWWLVAAAHEVGHQIQFEFPDLANRTRQALDDPWRLWHEELFADAYAVLLTGPAFIWAITELETGPAPPLDEMRESLYPPPLVRLAVIRALAERTFPEGDVARFASSAPGGDADLEPELKDLLDRVPAVADALLGVTVRGDRQLRGLATATARAYERGEIGDWERKLRTAAEPEHERTLGAARFCVAGSVAAWESLVAENVSAEQFATRTADLAGQVLGVLPKCAEPGRRGAPPGPGTAADAENLAARIAADLFATDLLADVRFPRGHRPGQEDGRP